MVTSELYRTVTSCRICGSRNLHPVMNLGSQALTGRFPAANEPDPPMAPLEVVRCENCGLVQLLHSVNVTEMFGSNYGYRSGTNATMRNHLAELTADLTGRAVLAAGDVVLDIGCNDGTLLKSYPIETLVKVGIDPIAETFRDQYPVEFKVHADFFNTESFARVMPGRTARAITSIAMFYDLDDPGSFVGDIAATLAPDGVWVLEQSYLPDMLDKNSFDTICHEHFEYYGLAQIEKLVGEKKLRVFDVKINEINGGSFQIWVCHADAKYAENSAMLQALRKREAAMDLSTDKPFAKFRETVASLGVRLKAFIENEVARGKRVYVYGASTKGNVLLQHFGLDHKLITACADRSPNKWGLRTPGTAIPIMSEEEARKQADYFLVLPWHFRNEFVAREADFIARGGHLIFPLPEFEVVGSMQDQGTGLHKEYWERNIEGFAGFYDKGSEESLGGPRLIRKLYRIGVLPIEKFYMKKRYNMVRKFIEDYVGSTDTFADIGCGSGVFSILAAEKGARVIALDFAQSALDLTERNIPKLLKPQIRTALMDVSKEGIPTVNSAIAIGVLPYVQDSGKFIANVAARADLIMFNFLNADHPINLIRRKLRPLDPRQYFYHDQATICDHLSKFGHRMISSERLATGTMIVSRRSEL
jgi:NDP-4-keto-2,6-dideoxyhexose 3-C-methyltransferase